MSLREGRAAPIIQATAGLAVIGLGSVALAGWLIDASALHTWRTGTIPMAPVTAVLFVLLGLVLCGLVNRNRLHDNPVARTTAAVGAIAAGVLLVLRLLGWYPDLERLGLVTPSATDIAPVGFMSPLTAAWFLLALTTILLAQPQSLPAPRWQLRAVFALACLTAVSSSLLLVMSLYGPPLLLGEGVVPVAAATASGMVTASIGLIALTVLRYRHERESEQTTAPGPGRFALLFVLVSVLVTIGAYVYFHELEGEVQQLHVAELEAVSDLKTDLLSQWRRERLGDAEIIHQRATIAELTTSLVQAPTDASLRSAMVSWFQGYEVYQQYDRLMVFDPNAHLVMSHPDAFTPDAALVSAVMAHMIKGEPGLLDFRRRSPDGRSTLTLVIPMFPPGSQKASGVIGLDIDPNRFLYPFLDRWPSSATQGETLLIGRDDAGVVILNSTRVPPSAPLTLRMDFSSGTVGVQAVNGARGIVQGIDYAGRPVLAVVSAVEDAPWLLVTKVNEAGVRAAVLRQLWLVISFAALILASAGGGLALVWRLVRERHYRAEATLAGSLQATTAKLARLIVHSPTIAYTLRRVGSGLVADDISDNIERLFGYTPAEVLADNWWTTNLHPDDRAGAEAAFARIEGADSGDAIEHEYRFRRKDGVYLWVLDQLQVVARDAAGVPTLVAGAWTDITTRRDAERSVRQSEHRLQLALSAAQQGMWDLDLVSGAAVVNTHYSTMLGYAPATFIETNADWFARLHPDDHDRCKTVFSDYVAGRRDNYQVEFRQKAADGSWIWIMSQGQIVERAADGTPLRMLGTHMDITARKEAETALRQSVHEKEALLKEVHHRVKNNLQVISSLLRLEGGRSTDPAVKSVLSDMQTRVLSMALLHEHLYRSGNLAKVDLSIYLTQLAHQVFYAAGPLANRVTLQLDVAPIRVDLDQAVPCGLLLNELLSNSLKHAFPDGRTGTVGVSLHLSPSTSDATLEVFDTGVGLPTDLADRRNRSLGLQLVDDLTRQLRGTLTVTSDHGVHWHLVFTPRPTPPDQEHTL